MKETLKRAKSQTIMFMSNHQVEVLKTSLFVIGGIVVYKAGYNKGLKTGKKQLDGLTFDLILTRKSDYVEKNQ